LAVSVSGSGETSTSVPGRLALCSVETGRQAGEVPPAFALEPLLLEPDMPRLREPVAIAARTHARTTTGRAM
jgi:hypothetical protein